MAVLSKHGHELYRYEGLTFSLSFRSDGEILRNNGQGWKLWKRLKPSTDVNEYVNRQKARHQELDRQQPAFVQFRDSLHDCVCLRNRCRVVEVLKAMPDDPDGVWSEFTDYMTGIELDISDCVRLCSDFRRLLDESETKGQAEQTAD